jgi:hypothetical protein
MEPHEFNIGVIKPVECMKEGWALIKDQYWLFFGISILGILIASAIPLVLIGPMFCGIYYCLLRKRDGHPVEFVDLFKGFDYFMPSLIVSLIIGGLSLVVSFIVISPTIAFLFASLDKRGRLDDAAIIPFLIFIGVMSVILALILGCVHSLILFAHLLIVDRKMAGMDALKMSAKASWQNIGGIGGFIGLQILLGICGYLLCIVGVYLFMPIAFAGTTVMYRKIFPALEPLPNFPNPPAPDYPGVGFN